MNVASKNLCQELYELTKWECTEKMWHGRDQFPDSWVAILLDNADSPGRFPAYDLGYLLRKLPKISPSNQDCYLTVIHKNVPKNKKTDKRWTAGYFEGFGWSWYANGDTPEDAAVKLAIELFKQGVLS